MISAQFFTTRPLTDEEKEVMEETEAAEANTSEKAS